MLQILSYILCRIFFRSIGISGTPYTGGRALWAANHTSGIVDPMILFGLAPVKLRPLAKHTLWDIVVMKQLLQSVNAIPVTRIKDIKIDANAEKEFADKEQEISDWRQISNNEAFAKITEALLKNDNILIFPEGVSHDDPFIYKFKTGIARMALQTFAKSEDSNRPVVIQPVAIDYSEKDEFRSDLNVHFCAPIFINSSNTSIADIMVMLRESLENGLATFFSWDEKRNWRFIFEMVYDRIPDSASEFCLFVEKNREAFDEDYELISKIQTMRRVSQAMFLSPKQLNWSACHSKKRSFFKRIITHGWFYLLLSLPIQIIGLIVWGFPVKICAKLAMLSTTDRDVRATMKITHGLWVFPAWAFFASTVLAYFMSFQFENVSHLFLWGVCLVLTPTFLIVSVLLSEQLAFFPGYWKLTRLRFLFPRGWEELMQEWQELQERVHHKIKGSAELLPLFPINDMQLNENGIMKKSS